MNSKNKMVSYEVDWHLDLSNTFCFSKTETILFIFLGGGGQREEKQLSCICTSI